VRFLHSSHANLLLLKRPVKRILLGETYLTARSGLVNTRFVHSYRGRKQAASQKTKKEENTMKKSIAGLFGLCFATAALTFAAQAPAPAAAPAPASTSTTTTAAKKQHVKKHKKADKPAAVAATPAVPATPAGK